MRKGSVWVVVSCGILMVRSAWGVTAWNESVGGDLSNNKAAPTPIGLVSGANSIFGSLRTTSSGDGQDWFVITVPAGFQVDQYRQMSYVSVDNVGFTGFQSGSSFPGSDGDPASYAGYTHMGNGLNGTDLLPQMQGQFGATDFTIPLFPGTYTFLLQQAGLSTETYQMDFVVSAAPVPEPATLSLLGTALVLTTRHTRRRG